VITDATLDTLAANDEAVTLLPHILSSIRVAKQSGGLSSGCGSCRKNANDKLQAAYGSAKMAIFTLQGDNVATLKRLLQADALRITLSGQTRDL
jgi:bacterioferritin-associated ferredoxin